MDTKQQEVPGACSNTEDQDLCIKGFIGAPLRPVPEVVLLLDPAGRVLRWSARHAGPRLGELEIRNRAHPHDILHPGCSASDCELWTSWREAWDVQEAGLPVEWLHVGHALEGVLKLRLQPVDYACGALFSNALEGYSDCRVLFVSDVGAAYTTSGQPKVRRRERVPLALDFRGEAPCDLVAALDRRLSSVTAELLALEEAQRRRIASELHDGLGQTLSLLRFEIEGLEEQADGRRGIAGTLSRAVEYVKHSQRELRRVTRNLRPVLLEEYGLFGAIGVLCDDFRGSCPDIELASSLDGDESRVPEVIATAIYRITQESLNNAARHARPSRVGVDLAADDDRISLRVADDGIGLAPERDPGKGIGLVTMRERTELLRGRFSLESRPGHGCSVTAHWSADAIRLLRD